MKKKVLFCTLLSVVVLALGLVLSSSNSVNVESEKRHDCSEHLAEAKISDGRCLACFRYLDEFGLCPMCDYEQCSRCSEWTYNPQMRFCRNCDENHNYNTCPLCGKHFDDCICVY